MSVAERPDAGTGELGLHAPLRPVGDHEIRAQRQDPFDIRIQQSSHARQRRHLWREIVEAAHRDDLGTRPDCEEHLGQGRDERDDPPCRRRSGGRARLLVGSGSDESSDKNDHDEEEG
jgi:hypothetical protein